MRILDANLNRTREALRVMEDYARFVLNLAQLSSELKNARHELREVAEMLDAQELLSGRNTPGDVGTTLCSAGEMERSDAVAVVTAACKRAVESLRVLEEFSKTAEPPAPKRFERLRYKCYDWEVQLTSRGRAKQKLQRMRLYVLISSALCKKNPLEVVRDVLAGGADCLQLREKQMPSGQYLALAKSIGSLCRERGKLFIVNDRPDIALAAGADGVHLGQDDLPIADARNVLPSEMIIGLSTHSIAQAKKAFKTITKAYNAETLSPATAKATCPGDYANLDELVSDLSKTIVENKRYGLKAIMADSLDGSEQTDLYSAQAGTPTEKILVQQALSMVGNLPKRTPYAFPDNTILVTPPQNLAIYLHKVWRRKMEDKEEKRGLVSWSERKRDFIVSDYDRVIMAKNIVKIKANPSVT